MWQFGSLDSSCKVQYLQKTKNKAISAYARFYSVGSRLLVPKTSLSLTCKEVRLICSEGLKWCSRVLFHPEIASESNFDLESLGLWAMLATFTNLNVASKCSGAHSTYSNPDFSNCTAYFHHFNFDSILAIYRRHQL